MKLNIKNLSGNALAYMTALLEKWPVKVYFSETGAPIYRDEAPHQTWDPVNNFEQSGAIIDKEKITTIHTKSNNTWWATLGDESEDAVGFDSTSRREAAMIAYVVGKLFKDPGSDENSNYPYLDEIDVSDDLTDLFADQIIDIDW